MTEIKGAIADSQNNFLYLLPCGYVGTIHVVVCWLVSYRPILSASQKRAVVEESSYDEPRGEDEYEEGASDEEVARVPLHLDKTDNTSHMRSGHE
jgi:hypothetical protein